MCFVEGMLKGRKFNLNSHNLKAYLFALASLVMLHPSQALSTVEDPTRDTDAALFI
jgi:hypothetical protein